MGNYLHTGWKEDQEEERKWEEEAWSNESIVEEERIKKS